MRQIENRTEAGLLLAEALRSYEHEPNLMVLGLPRGGVPVAFEVANAFQVSLDVFIVRKLGVPGNEELAMGAISSGGVRVLNQSVIEGLEIPPKIIELVTERENTEIMRQEALYRRGRAPVDVTGKSVILIDDGLATGSTMLAALRALQAQGPAQIIGAVPVSPPAICEELSHEADQMICLMTPEPFFGVGIWYEDFSQVTTEEVIYLLEQAKIWTKNLPRDKSLHLVYD